MTAWLLPLLKSNMSPNDNRIPSVPPEPDEESWDDTVEEEPNDFEAEKHLEWLEGHKSGHVSGFEAGLVVGREQGYEDCLYRLRRMAEHEPELEEAVNYLLGEL